MAANIAGDSAVGRLRGVDVEVDFKDIMRTLQMGAMLRGEALHRSGWGIMLDYAFMRLSDDISLRRGGVTDATIRQGIMEAFVFHRVVQEPGQLDLYDGLRWWANDLRIRVDPAILPGSREVRGSENWIDPVLGGRYAHPLGNRWEGVLQGDFGGFGIASDFTLSLSAGVTCRIGEQTHLDFRYKGLWVDYETGTPGNKGYFEYDTLTHGPLIGLIYTFQVRQGFASTACAAATKPPRAASSPPRRSAAQGAGDSPAPRDGVLPLRGIFPRRPEGALSCPSWTAIPHAITRRASFRL